MKEMTIEQRLAIARNRVVQSINDSIDAQTEGIVIDVDELVRIYGPESVFFGGPEED